MERKFVYSHRPSNRNSFATMETTVAQKAIDSAFHGSCPLATKTETTARAGNPALAQSYRAMDFTCPSNVCLTSLALSFSRLAARMATETRGVRGEGFLREREHGVARAARGDRDKARAVAYMIFSSDAMC